MLTEFIVIIIWRYLQMLKHHAVHLKLLQCYMLITSIKKDLFWSLIFFALFYLTWVTQTWLGLKWVQEKILLCCFIILIIHVLKFYPNIKYCSFKKKTNKHITLQSKYRKYHTLPLSESIKDCLPHTYRFATLHVPTYKCSYHKRCCSEVAFLMQWEF